MLNLTSNLLATTATPVATWPTALVVLLRPFPVLVQFPYCPIKAASSTLGLSAFSALLTFEVSFVHLPRASGTPISRLPCRRRTDWTCNSTGHLRSLNDLAKKAQANYIIHTGDFGFYDESSLERIAEK